MTDVAVKVEKQLDLKEPPLYKVIFIDDDVTPMDFVIKILMTTFKHTLEESQELTHKVDSEGSAIVAILPYEIAEQHGIEVTVLARNNNYPLQVKIEADK
jgi:ATP-dependent Clp protease adaptor protein ClpS